MLYVVCLLSVWLFVFLAVWLFLQSKAKAKHNQEQAPASLIQFRLWMGLDCSSGGDEGESLLYYYQSWLIRSHAKAMLSERCSMGRTHGFGPLCQKPCIRRYYRIHPFYAPAFVSVTRWAKQRRVNFKEGTIISKNCLQATHMEGTLPICPPCSVPLPLLCPVTRVWEKVGSSFQ
jgi:hypothetical protein